MEKKSVNYIHDYKSAQKENDEVSVLLFTASVKEHFRHLLWQSEDRKTQKWLKRHCIVNIKYKFNYFKYHGHCHQHHYSKETAFDRSNIQLSSICNYSSHEYMRFGMCKKTEGLWKTTFASTTFMFSNYKHFSANIFRFLIH